MDAMVSPKPDWAADAIWYQIFPERFCNGCAASDPTADDAGVPLARFPEWRIRPWGLDWEAPDDWGQARAEDRSFRATVFHRRNGGDLPGLRKRLPYLRELGVSALYLNPIFQAPSLHKYDAACLHHVDPTLGPDRAGDLARLAAAHETEDPATWIWTAADLYLLDLLDEAHAMGFRVILDGVFNHCGRRFFAFRDLLEKGRASRYADWFQVTRWREDGGFDYAAWDGPNASLPNFARTAETLAEGPRRYVFDITERWVRPAPDGVPRRGIDGWRLDVAYCLPHGFWREWHAHLRRLLPDAYTTAELVGPSQEYLGADEFSAAMNYEWLYPTLGFFTGADDALTADEFARRISRLLDRHPFPTTLVMQNLLESHDTGRVLTMFENAAPPFESWDPYFNFARQDANPGLTTRAPSPETIARLRLAAFWQFTAPGAPMLYYGTELGLHGANDPSCRKPMPWPPTADGIPPPAPPDTAVGLFPYYKALCGLRKAYVVLRRGDLRFLPSPHPRVLHYKRSATGETVEAWINASRETIEVPSSCAQRRVLFRTDAPGETVTTLPPLTGVLLEA